jgi:HEAT repeat protein
VDRRVQAWLDAASSCGLQVTEASSRSGLKAWVGLWEVRIEPCDDESQRACIVLVLPGSGDFIVVKIRPEEPGQLPPAGEIEVGDAPFDARFSIQGPLRMVLALLDTETRSLLLRLSTANWLEVSIGSIRAKTSAEDVPHLLPLLLDLGRRLTPQSMGVDTPRRLAANVKRDPEAGVRRRNLLLLINEYPQDAATAEALRSACSDQNPELRLLAAKEMGAEGYPVLLELAESREDDALSAKAVSILGRRLPVERAATILDQALGEHRIQTIWACLEALSYGENAATVEPLTKVLAHKQGELAAAAAQALGRTGSAAAESPLLQALEHQSPAVRTAAVNALGRVGSVAAVLPLRDVAKRFRFDRDLRQAARQAIAEIQSRLSDASPGQLSLAGAEGGQLSLAQNEAGQLSLAPDQAGELSLSSEETGELSLSDDEEGPKP